MTDQERARLAVAELLIDTDPWTRKKIEAVIEAVLSAVERCCYCTEYSVGLDAHGAPACDGHGGYLNCYAATDVVDSGADRG